MELATRLMKLHQDVPQDVVRLSYECLSVLRTLTPNTMPSNDVGIRGLQDCIGQLCRASTSQRIVIKIYKNTFWVSTIA